LLPLQPVIPIHNISANHTKDCGDSEENGRIK